MAMSPPAPGNRAFSWSSEVSSLQLYVNTAGVVSGMNLQWRDLADGSVSPVVSAPLSLSSLLTPGQKQNK